MNRRGLIRQPLSILLIAFAIIPLLLAACQPVSVSTSLPPAQPQPAATTLPTVPPAPTRTPATTTGDIAFELCGVAQGQIAETVEPWPSTSDSTWFGSLPQYYRVTLKGYPVAGSSIEPQIFI